MKTIIKTDKLYRTFKVGDQTITAVKNISIDIYEGSLTILKGRSGSGKTTLINLLGVIDTPTEGKIIVEDKITNNMSEQEKNELRQKLFGFVFQSGALIPNMTVYENVELSLRLRNLPPEERKLRVEHCLNCVGLAKKVNQFPEELSGGEMQRVGIARAIAPRPKVILADEPTSALDYSTGLLVVKLFKDLVAHEGTTLIMATHDPKLVPMSDYVYNIKDGEVVNE